MEEFKLHCGSTLELEEKLDDDGDLFFSASGLSEYFESFIQNKDIPRLIQHLREIHDNYQQGVR